jgi:hypothetical protein
MRYCYLDHLAGNGGVNRFKDAEMPAGLFKMRRMEFEIRKFGVAKAARRGRLCDAWIDAGDN